METNELPIKTNTLQNLIHTIRGVQVMIDRDLAKIYEVDLKRLNEQVKRNINRFPQTFRFQITQNEAQELKEYITTFNARNLRSQFATSSQNEKSNNHGGRRYLPYAFTEQGVAMLSAVLRSDIAIQTSIRIIQAFVEMRRYIATNGGLMQRMDTIEKRQFSHELKTDERFDQIFDALEDKTLTRTQGIFFEGQIFDAYVFINDLLRQAKHSIVLIDNFIDDSVLMQLAKRAPEVSATLLTKSITPQLQQDLEKHNAQYAPISVHEFTFSHDRFLILDDDIVYHIGASLKDLGKRWFAFSRIQIDTLRLMDRLQQRLKVQIDKQYSN